MDEAALDLATVPWSRQKEMVRVFYKEMWDHANTALVPQLFHPDFGDIHGLIGRLKNAPAA